MQLLIRCQIDIIHSLREYLLFWPLTRNRAADDIASCLRDYCSQAERTEGGLIWRSVVMVLSFHYLAAPEVVPTITYGAACRHRRYRGCLYDNIQCRQFQYNWNHGNCRVSVKIQIYH